MSIGELFASFFWAYIFFTCIWIFVIVFINVFRDPGLGGGRKALWVLFLVVVPFLGAFVYLIARGGKMGRRGAETQGHAAGQAADIGTVGARATTTSDIESAKKLLDSGAITETEFETLKAQALAR